MPEDKVELVRLSNPWCTVTIAPAIGGRIVSMLWRPAASGAVSREGHELLWHNSVLELQACEPGTPYDPQFYGGIDELLPCDLPETIDGIQCADHGELWTTPLQAEMPYGGSDHAVRLHGVLPRFGLQYERLMRLAPDKPELICDYRITNPTGEPRHFLWKPHAAIAVQPGDVIECPARWAKAADAAYTTCPDLEPFEWPFTGGQDKSLIPAADGTCEFLYLYDLSEGRMGWRSPSRNLSFTYHFDLAVFPYAWLFQSFGGFDGHYTTVLEPCTTMPIAVADAAALGQCSVLGPGQELATTVRMVFGPIAAEGGGER